MCGVNVALVLSVGPNGLVRCYEHLDGTDARVEADHVAGRANLPGLTVDLQANAHRRVTDLRRQFGTDEWPEAAGDPVLTLAHFLAGFATILLVLAEWLRDLATSLIERLGPRWWERAPASPLG